MGKGDTDAIGDLAYAYIMDAADRAGALEGIQGVIQSDVTNFRRGLASQFSGIAEFNGTPSQMASAMNQFQSKMKELVEVYLAEMASKGKGIAFGMPTLDLELYFPSNYVHWFAYHLATDQHAHDLLDQQPVDRWKLVVGGRGGCGDCPF